MMRKLIAQFVIALAIVCGLSIINNAEVNASPTLPEDAKVIFTDILYEDWTKSSDLGSNALFDHNIAAGVVSDLCGPVFASILGRAYDTHKGWDRNIPNDNGNYIVFAVAPGIVESTDDHCVIGPTGCNGGAGNFVKIRHNKRLVTKYFHLQHKGILVAKNEWVDRRHPLAIGSNTGHSSGHHVHLQIELDGIALDPVELHDYWEPKLQLDFSGCTNNPAHNFINYENLKGFATKKLKPINDKLTSVGFVVTEPQRWMFKSGGSNPDDAIVQTYTNTSKNNALAIYDLIGNAPDAIGMDPNVAAWWWSSAHYITAGRPLAAYDIAPGITEFDFVHGYIAYDGNKKTITKEVDDYPEATAPGIFVDGWKGGKSYAIIAAYKQHGGSPNVGFPTGKDAGTPTVHEWSGAWLQDFNGGKLGSCGIMLSNKENPAATAENPFTAFLIAGVFWDVYRAAGNGPALIGTPQTDPYYDESFKMLRQDFENGYTILESGLLIKTSSGCAANIVTDSKNCACPNQTKTTPCEKCGIQQWICKNYAWEKNGSCGNQGVCAPGDTENPPCGQPCMATKKRVCANDCTWGPFSPCSQLPTEEVCDDKDNDCDGEVDEGNVCCYKNQEVCNGIDDNCNGETDEGVTNACGGCKTFVYQPATPCGIGGTWECSGNNDMVCKELSIPKSPTPPAIPDPPIPPSTPPPIPTPDPNPPQPQTNQCGGTSTLSYTVGTPCGSTCGTWQCNGPNNITCASGGVCTPYQTTTQSCSLGGLCGSGVQTQTCTGSCQWGPPSGCTATNGSAWAFNPGKVCGNKFCFQLTGVSGSTAIGVISRVNGVPFNKNPIEWAIDDVTTGKTLALPIGTGCDKIYEGYTGAQVYINIGNLNGPSTHAIHLTVWYGLKCVLMDITSQTYLQKCN